MNRETESFLTLKYGPDYIKRVECKEIKFFTNYGVSMVVKDTTKDYYTIKLSYMKYLKHSDGIIEDLSREGDVTYMVLKRSSNSPIIIYKIIDLSEADHLYLSIIHHDHRVTVNG